MAVTDDRDRNYWGRLMGENVKAHLADIALNLYCVTFPSFWLRTFCKCHTLKKLLCALHAAVLTR